MIYYDLKEEAQNKTIGNVIGREIELKRILRTLKRQYNNNVVIVGPSGTGKTTLLEGFCYQITKGKIAGFEKTVLAKIDNNSLKRLLEQSTNPEISSYIASAFKSLPHNSIIFIDDFHLLANDKQDLSRIFDAFSEPNAPRLFLTIADDKFAKLEETQQAFLKNFEIINLKENDIKETQQIMLHLAPAFEKEYGIKIDPSALNKLVEQTKRINPEKKFPIATIHLLDECLAYAKISGEKKLVSKQINEIYAEKTGVPSTSTSADETRLLKDLETEMKKGIIGQDHAVKTVADVVRRSRMGLRNPNRPSGSFLFLGPSGVGKTELAKILAKTVYGSERAFTRIDMSEFGEAHTVQRLIGAPPGYVGFETGGQLTNALKEQPYSLVLLDEIEKAHSKIFDIFLQVFDDGRLTDGRGQTVSFTNSILVATSNLGINEIVNEFQNSGSEEAGFTRLADPKFLEEKLMPILLKNFRTEFLNRFDGIIVFNPLSTASLLEIALLEIKKIEQRTAEHNIKFNIDPTILSGKIAELNDYRFGARPVKRFVEQTCEGLIVKALLR